MRYTIVTEYICPGNHFVAPNVTSASNITVKTANMVRSAERYCLKVRLGVDMFCECSLGWYVCLTVESLSACYFNKLTICPQFWASFGIKPFRGPLVCFAKSKRPLQRAFRQPSCPLRCFDDAKTTKGHSLPIYRYFNFTLSCYAKSIPKMDDFWEIFDTFMSVLCISIWRNITSGKHYTFLCIFLQLFCKTSFKFRWGVV